MSNHDDKILPFSQSKDDAIIAELVAMSPMDYERQREAKAKELNIRVSMLDRFVTGARPQDEAHDEPSPFDDVEPWDSPVNGSELLSEIVSNITRFCVLPEYSGVLMASWILHAWTHDASDISPILAFVSPEKRCGKTTALSVVGAMAPKAMHNVNISSAVLFRVITIHKPTVLIDEADTFLTDNEELRGIINSGHNRLSAYVWRSVGDEHEPKQFKVWSPKCIAMIGKLPDTLEDRALVVPLRRKQTGEVVERFRADRLADFLPLRRKAQRWADDNMARLRELDPNVPDSLNDRAQDNARAICAIADIAGDEWPHTIRTALVGLASQADDEPRSAGVLLLSDIAELFKTRKGTSIGSSDLVDALCELEESPWAEWRRDSPITTRGVAKLLKPYDIKPTRNKHGRFYQIADFTEAFSRYVSGTPDLSVTSVTSDTSTQEKAIIPNETRGLSRVSLSDPMTLASDTPELSVTKKPNEINKGDACVTCDAYSEGVGKKVSSSTQSVTKQGGF